MIKQSFNEAKTLNAAIYISERVNRSDLHKIFKILYFSDRQHFFIYGRTITGDSYYALGDGPVPTKTYDIFKSVRGDSYFTDTQKFGEYFSIMNWDIFVASKKADLDVLSKTDTQILDEMIHIYGNLSFDEIKEKSHDYAWRTTSKNQQISFENIMIESGADRELIDYITQINEIQESFA